MATAVGARAQANRPFFFFVFSTLFVDVRVFDHSTLTPNSSKSTENRAKCKVTVKRPNHQPNWRRAGGPRTRENTSNSYARAKKMHRAKNLVKHVQKLRIYKTLVNNVQNATDKDFTTFDQNTVKTRVIGDPTNQPSAANRHDGTDSRPKPRKSRTTST